MDEIRIGPGLKGPDLNRNNQKRVESRSNFEGLLDEAITKINEVQRDAEKAVKELAQGGDITQAIISIEKADMSFQLMVEIRNRLLNAYEEIMRMQV